METKKNKVNKILSKLKGYEAITSIPIGWWITSPDKVKEALKTAKKQLE